MLKNYKIQEICTLEKGKQIDTTCLNDSNPYQYINGGINASGFYGKYNTDENTVIVSEGGASCGYVNYVTEKFWCGCHCYKLINPKVTPKYLYYALKGNQNSIMELRTGAAMPNIKKSSFNDMNIKLDDDKNVQATVISSLDKIQTLIDGKNTQLKSLDELVKSRFIEMFGDAETSKFPTKKLHEVCEELFAGGDVKKNALSPIKTIEYPVPIYTNGEKNDGLYGYTNKARVTKEAVTISGRGTIGYTSLRTEPFYPAVRLIVAVPNQIYISGMYLKHFISTLEYNGQGNTIPQLTVPMVKDELIPLPPIELQNTFAEFVKQVDKSKFVVLLA